ncbi:MAG: HD domain-containing protein [Bacteroidia bacterium]|nr:HD domain-containing protein [Bacteroidia bacterium]
MADSNQLLAEAQDFVSGIFRDRINKRFPFHNIEHTLYVVTACAEIASAYTLSEEDILVLSLAAWFHDTGYAAEDVPDHEKESIKTATGFLRLKHHS